MIKKCEECQGQAKKSRIDVVSKERIGDYVPPEEFWDENGLRHVHDHNRRRIMYRCSQGHEWQETEKRACWCRWEKE